MPASAGHTQSCPSAPRSPAKPLASRKPSAVAGLAAVMAVGGLLTGCGQGGPTAEPQAAPGSAAGTPSPTVAAAVALTEQSIRSMSPTSMQAEEWFGLPTADYETTLAEVAGMGWQYVSAGAVKQAVACIGQGSPTVLLSDGANGFAAWDWNRVAQGIARTNRVCLFDRPGNGFSPGRPSGETASPVDHAKEMLALAEAVGEKPPYVLVGWSLGGLAVRTAAGIAPDSVAGLVLVDATGPSLYRKVGPPEEWIDGGQQLDMKAAEDAIGSGPDLGSKPVVALFAGKSDAPRAVRKAIAESDEQSKTISDNLAAAVIPESNHAIPILAPEAVVAATRAVARAVTSGSDLPACPKELAAAGGDC